MRNIVTLSLTLLISTGAAIAADGIAAAPAPSAPVPSSPLEPKAAQPKAEQPDGKTAKAEDKAAGDVGNAEPVPAPQPQAK